MADAPKQEPLDERFARHLRQSRYEQIQDSDDTAVACSLQVNTTTVPNATTSSLHFATSDVAGEPDFFDTDGFLGSDGSSYITIPASGVYAVMAGVDWESDVHGERVIAVGGNAHDFATPINVCSPLPADAGPPWTLYQVASGLSQFTEGEQVFVDVYHDAGGNLDVNSGRFALCLLHGLELSSTIIS